MPEQPAPAVIDIVDAQLALRKWTELTASGQYRALDLTPDQVCALMEIISASTQLVEAIAALPGPSIIVRRTQE